MTSRTNYMTFLVIGCIFTPPLGANIVKSANRVNVRISNFNVVLLLEISIIVYSSMMSIGLKMLIELISIFLNINAMTLKLRI